METFFFYLFAVLALGCGALVVANPFSRNPVNSALFLVLTILSLAGLFVLLHAFFLAAVQVLVYAGAVMVLFLFVIMLLNLPEEERRRTRKVLAVLGTAAVALLGWLFLQALTTAHLSASHQTPVVQGETHPLGVALFTRFLLPFEVVSVLLLVAMVGVLVLGRKEPKP